MGVREGPGKGVSEQDSALMGVVWVKKGNPEVLHRHFPNDTS